MSELKKVLFILPPTIGGAEHVTLILAKCLPIDKYKVKVIIVGKNIKDLSDFLPDNVSVHMIRCSSIWEFVTLRIVRLFYRECPNVVFCSLHYLNFRVIAAAKIVGGIKVIVRENISIKRSSYINRFFCSILYPKANLIVSQTEEMQEDLKTLVKVDDNKLRVISNPIDKQRIDALIQDATCPFEQSVNNIVYVGRVDRTKGVDVLLKAFAQVLRKNSASRLHVLGKFCDTEAYREELLSIINESGIEDSVLWYGPVGNPYPYMKYADVFVLASRVEGLPNVILEAMYLGTPVVVTRSVPVINRIVAPANGYVVDVDDVLSISEAILSAFSIPNKPYCCEEVLQKYLDIFNQI